LITRDLGVAAYPNLGILPTVSSCMMRQPASLSVCRVLLKMWADCGRIERIGDGLPSRHAGIPEEKRAPAARVFVP
jgi:hypothetical protein